MFLTTGIADGIIAAAGQRYRLPEYTVDTTGQIGQSWRAAACFIAAHSSPSEREWIDIGADAVKYNLSPLCPVIIPALEIEIYLAYINAWMKAQPTHPVVCITRLDRTTAEIKSTPSNSMDSTIIAAIHCIQTGYVFGLVRQRLPCAELQVAEPQGGTLPTGTVKWKDRTCFRKLFSRVVMYRCIRSALVEITDAMMSSAVLSAVDSVAESSRPVFEVLTLREREVADMLLRGNTRTEIAETLHVALPTIKRHTEKIYKKLGIHSRFQLLNVVRGNSDGAK